MINGYPVTIDSIAKIHWQTLCADDADGLDVFIHVGGAHPVMSVASVFAHLRLYGPNPVHWTTKPIG